MDTLQFKKTIYPHPDGEGELVCAMIKINGQPLLDLVREHELPYARKYDQESIAGGYEYQLATRLHQLLTDPDARIGGAVTLMICGCREEGCWPLLAEIFASDQCVTWQYFRNPHREIYSKGGFWDYRDFGPFRFAKDAYWDAVNSIKW